MGPTAVALSCGLEGTTDYSLYDKANNTGTWTEFITMVVAQRDNIRDTENIDTTNLISF